MRSLNASCVKNAWLPTFTGNKRYVQFCSIVSEMLFVIQYCNLFVFIKLKLLINFPKQRVSAAWPSGTARRWQILRDGFYSRLEPIAFDVYNGWLLTRKCKLTSQSLSISIKFSVRYNLKIISVIYIFKQNLLISLHIKSDWLNSYKFAALI